MNVSKITEKYVYDHPSIKECLKNGFINYSALSRTICEKSKLKKSSFDAVLIACRRLHRKIKSEALKEDNILKILKNSKVELKNKIVVLVLEKDIHLPNLIEIEKKAIKKNEVFHIIEGVSAITAVTSEDFFEMLQKTFKNKIIKKNKELAQITLKSPKEIEETPGAIAYLYSLLGENHINIYETMSCWTDTIFVIKEKEISKVMEVLSF